MMKFAIVFGLSAAVAGAPASAEVVEAKSDSFEIRHEVIVPLAPEAAQELFMSPARYWNPAHSYSGIAENFQMINGPGGCFCERLGTPIDPRGYHVHMTVMHYEQEKNVTLFGGLGPLMGVPATGPMSIDFSAEGEGTRVTLRYKVVGFPDKDGRTWAGAVDGVLGEQMERLVRAAEGETVNEPWGDPPVIVDE